MRPPRDIQQKQRQQQNQSAADERQSVKGNPLPPLLRRGYGYMAKQVVEDPRTDAYDIAVYGLYVTFVGNGSGRAYPKRDWLLKTLPMGRAAFYKHRNKLENLGYLQIEIRTNSKGQQISSNVLVPFDLPEPLEKTAGDENAVSEGPGDAENAPAAKPSGRGGGLRERIHGSPLAPLLRRGYGLLAKQVYLDPRLGPKEEAIYAYYVTFVGDGSGRAFPTVEETLVALHMNRHTFYEHRNKLVELGYLRVELRSDSRHNRITSEVFVPFDTVPEIPDDGGYGDGDANRTAQPHDKGGDAAGDGARGYGCPHSDDPERETDGADAPTRPDADAKSRTMSDTVEPDTNVTAQDTAQTTEVRNWHHGNGDAVENPQNPSSEPKCLNRTPTTELWKTDCGKLKGGVRNWHLRSVPESNPPLGGGDLRQPSSEAQNEMFSTAQYYKGIPKYLTCSPYVGRNGNGIETANRTGRYPDEPESANQVETARLLEAPRYDWISLALGNADGNEGHCAETKPDRKGDGADAAPRASQTEPLESGTEHDGNPSSANVAKSTRSQGAARPHGRQTGEPLAAPSERREGGRPSQGSGPYPALRHEPYGHAAPSTASSFPATSSQPGTRRGRALPVTRPAGRSAATRRAETADAAANTQYAGTGPQTQPYAPGRPAVRLSENANRQPAADGAGQVPAAATGTGAAAAGRARRANPTASSPQQQALAEPPEQPFTAPVLARQMADWIGTKDSRTVRGHAPDAEVAPLTRELTRMQREGISLYTVAAACEREARLRGKVPRITAWAADTGDRGLRAACYDVMERSPANIRAKQQDMMRQLSLRDPLYDRLRRRWKALEGLFDQGTDRVSWNDVAEAKREADAYFGRHAGRTHALG